MNWPNIISWGAAIFTIAVAIISVRNVVKFERWAKRRYADIEVNQARSLVLLNELNVLDPRIDMHRLRFHLFVMMADATVPDEVKTHISAALANAMTLEEIHGHA